MIELPPKRFEDIQNPRFDSIRHKPWFAKLGTRRKKLPSLKCAYDYVKQGSLQKDAAGRFTVDVRELRDYVAFRDGVGNEYPPEFHRILDEAYDEYCLMNGDRNLNSFIERIAPLYGQSPRHVIEAWEVDPTFLPTNYAQTK